MTRPIVPFSPEEQKQRAIVEEWAAKGEAALPDLLARLSDPSWVVRRAVVGGLAAIGAPAVAPLCAILSGDRSDETVLAAAVEALVLSRSEPDAALLTLTESDVPATVCDAVQVLGRRLSAAAIPRLTALIQAQDDNVALAAIEAFGRLGGEAALAPLLATVELRSFPRAFAAMDVLGGTGSARAVAALLPLLDEPLYGIEAARALGRLADPAAIPLLTTFLRAPEDARVRAGAAAISAILDAQIQRYAVDPWELAPAAEDAVARAHVLACLARPGGSDRPALVRVLAWLGRGAHVESVLVSLLSSDPETCRAAREALAWLTPAGDEELLAALPRANGEQRWLILELLSDRASSTGPVAACLEDADPKVRAAACDRLGKLGDTSVTVRLFPLLGDADLHVAQRALAAILALRAPETERFALGAARSGILRIRRAGLRILGHVADAAGLEVLLAAADDADERVRETALAGLARLEDPRALRALLAATSRAEPPTRAAAVRALAHVTSLPEATTALRRCLDDPDAWVRYFACQALGRRGDAASTDAIGARLEDTAGQVRVAAVEALSLLGGASAAARLRAAASSGDPELRRAAIVGLGQLGDPASVDELRRALASADPATRLVAVSSLGAYDLSVVGPDLDGALCDKDPGVRNAAIAVLSTLPAPEAAAILAAHLTDRDLAPALVQALARPIPGRASALANALLGASAATAPLLVSAIVRSNRAEAAAVLSECFASADAPVRRAIAPALGLLRTPSGRSLLARAAEHDPDDEVREIGRIAARRP